MSWTAGDSMLPNESLLPSGLIADRGWLTAFACRIMMWPRGRAWR